MPTYTQRTKTPWTQQVDHLTNTIGSILEARRQRQMMEQQQKQADFQQGLQKASVLERAWENTGDPSYKPMYEAQLAQLGITQPKSIGGTNVPQITTQAPTGPSTPESVYQGFISKGYHPRVAEKLTQSWEKTNRPVGAEETQIVDVEDPSNPGKTIKVVVKRATGEHVGKVGNIIQRPETFKEQYIGPAANSQGMDVWTVYDELGKGKTELRPSAGVALPRNIGRTPATEMNRGIALDTIIGNIGRIKQNYNPEYVGPVAGRVGTVKEATVGLPEQQSMFYADTRDIADMLLRARSGAQINEQEYNRLSKLVPTPNLPPKSFEARMKRFEDQLAQIMQAQQERLSAGNYLPGPKRPKDVEQPQPTQPSNYSAATMQLIERAKSGDNQAAMFLKSKGVTY